MNPQENTVLSVMDYEKIDGRLAPCSLTRGLTLGLSDNSEAARREIVARLWQDAGGGELSLSGELPFHRVLDLAILACQSLLYFREAYRLPKLYDPANPVVERVGLQGGAMTVRVCTENPALDADIADFSQELSNQGELFGERVRTLARLIEGMGY